MSDEMGEHEFDVLHGLFERYKKHIKRVSGRLLFLETENIRLGKDLCRTNDRVFALETNFIILDRYARSLELSKESKSKKESKAEKDFSGNNIPALVYGNIYSLLQGNGVNLFFVARARNGEMCIHSFPEKFIYPPEALNWRNMVLLGDVTQLLNP